MISPNETLLTNEDANGVLGRVCCFRGDATLHALIRAIIIEHTEDVDVDQIGMSSYIDVRAIKKPDNINVFEVGGPITIVEVSDWAPIEAPKDWYAYNEATFCLNRYLSQFAPTQVFKDKYSGAILFVTKGEPSSEWQQAVASMLWGLLPECYPLGAKSPEIASFFKKLAVGSKEFTPEQQKKTIIDFCNKVAAKIDFRMIRLKTVLQKYVDYARVSNIGRYKYDLDDLRGKISSARDRLESYYKSLEEKTILLASLEATTAKSSDEVINFFNTHKQCSITNVSNDVLQYGVTDTLEYYDVDEAEKLFNNTHSWVWDSFTADDIRYLKALFCESRGICKVSAHFTLSAMRYVTPQSGSYPDSTTMPNPHIYFYGCSGGNDAYYDQYANSGDWDLAIEQSISATKNWSVGDSTVGRRMMSWIIKSTVPFIYVSDGSPVSSIDGLRRVTWKEFKKLVDEKGKEKENV